MIPSPPALPRVSTMVVPAVLVLGFVALGVTVISDLASGTPTYAARAGRTCDNCHLDPSYWVNPELSGRKCTLSCQGCHVDPAGGGMRNAAGRFYGKSTLPMIASEPRPTRDWDREFLGLFYRRDRATVYNENLPRGPSAREEQHEPAYAPSDRFAFGTPSGGMGPHSYTQGRYGSLRADPRVRVGWDVRAAVLASLSGYGNRTLAFPMQADLGLAVQPIEHLTALFNLGARGQSEGLESVFDDPRTPYLREAFLLAHEFPYQAYVKAGRFTPSYGLRLDDHTSFIRRGLGLDASLPETRVTGVEAGASPNYPFVNLSWFKGKREGMPPEAFNVFDTDAGWGTALNVGYRELGWAIGGSALHRSRSLEDGGEMTAWGIYGVLNPWYYAPSLPLTYQAEIDRGEYRRTSGSTAQTVLVHQELTWLAGNGVNFVLAHDFEDPDREVAFDGAHRVNYGVQITFTPGLSIDARHRILAPRRDEAFITGDTPSATQSDFFIQFHFWN